MTELSGQRVNISSISSKDYPDYKGAYSTGEVPESGRKAVYIVFGRSAVRANIDSELVEFNGKPVHPNVMAALQKRAHGVHEFPRLGAR